MALNPCPTCSSTCCDASSRSQQTRDLQEQEINDSYERVGSVNRCSSANDSKRVGSCCQSSSDVPSIDQGPNQEMPNIQAAEGCYEVEK